VDHHAIDVKALITWLACAIDCRAHIVLKRQRLWVFNELSNFITHVSESLEMNNQGPGSVLDGEPLPGLVALLASTTHVFVVPLQMLSRIVLVHALLDAECAALPPLGEFQTECAQVLIGVGAVAAPQALDLAARLPSYQLEDGRLILILVDELSGWFEHLEVGIH
jgi:hypothetical protein